MKLNSTIYFFFVIIVFLAFFHFAGISNPLIIHSILFAFSISVINYVLFIVFYRISIKKSNKLFLIYNLGGMTFRLILMLLLVFIVLNYLKVEQYAFIFAFYILYIILLINEVFVVKDSLNRKRE